MFELDPSSHYLVSSVFLVFGFTVGALHSREDEIILEEEKQNRGHANEQQTDTDNTAVMYNSSDRTSRDDSERVGPSRGSSSNASTSCICEGGSYSLLHFEQQRCVKGINKL